MIVSGYEGSSRFLSSRRGRLHIISLVSSKSNIESIVLVAAILDYGNITLHVDEDDHIGCLCRYNVYAGFKYALLYSVTVHL